MISSIHTDYLLPASRKTRNPSQDHQITRSLYLSSLFVLFCLFFSPQATAQIDHKTINWQAVDSAFYKQYNPEIPPKWLFPIIFEEGTGMRDTLYLGYHPDATWHISEENASYGEKSVTFDTSYFNASWIPSPNWDFNQTKNVRVASLYENEKIRAGWIEFHNAVYPLYMYWDVKRLRSDSLPFEDQTPAPHAEGLLYVNNIYPENESGNIGGCDMHIPALITDSARIHADCVGRDFFVFDNFPWTDFDEVQTIEYFEIRKWLGFYDGLNLEKPAQGTTVLLYPNPSTGILNIDYNYPGRFRIISTLGKVVTEGDIEAGNTIIDLSHLHAGIYLFQILDEYHQIQFNEKLIVKP